MTNLTSRTQIALALLIRLGLLIISTGGFAQAYYLEFLESFNSSLDPWTDWIDSGGRSDALPYGLVLFTLLLMEYLISTAATSSIGIDSFVILYAVTVITCDLLVAKVLRDHSNFKASQIYLLSPLVIYVNMIYLQTDVFIGLFILIASVLLAQRKSRLSGIFLGLAIGSKFGLIIIFPFLLIYAAFNKRLQSNILEVVFWSTGVSLLAYLPALWSEGFRQMVFGTSESINLVELSIFMGNHNFYLFPAVYVLFCFWVYKNSRSGLHLVIGFIGCGLFSLALFSESAVGWFLWGIPTMVYVGIFTKIGTGAIFLIVQVAVIFRDITFGNLRNLNYGLNEFSFLLSNSFYTLTLALGSLWTLSVLRETTRLSDPLNLIERPLSVVVAGDSGVGKDTFVESIEELVGPEAITVIHGDGYHKHERGHLKWSVNTHLNPLENQIEEWSRDFRRAIQREDIYTRSYNHANGRFEYLDGAKPRDLIIGQGLLAFYGLDDEKVDVKLFLEMEEELRFHLKVRRDTSTRGHSKEKVISEIKKRKSDYKKYIEVQKLSADLIIRQECTNKKLQLVDTIVVQTKKYALADFLFQNCTTMIQGLEYRKRRKELQEIVFHHTQLTGSNTINCVLKRGFEQFDDYFPKEKNLQHGSVGLIATLALLTLAFKRKVTN